MKKGQFKYKIDDNLAKEIINLYSEGHSIKELSVKNNVSYMIIDRLLIKEGIKRKFDTGKYNIGRSPPNKNTKLRLEKDKILDSYKRLTMPELCKEFNCKPDMIRTILKENNSYDRDFRKNRKFSYKYKLGEQQRKNIRKAVLENYENHPEIIDKIKEARKHQITPKKDTTIEVKIQNFLKQLGIEFFIHQYIKKIEHGYQCDILIPSMKLVIECFGDYWHKIPYGREIDSIRCQELRQAGYKVLVFWEREIKAMEIDDLNNELNIREVRI